MSIIVAGIHTGIGKTMASAVLANALEYNYWKPVQAGELDFTDSDFVRRYGLSDSQVAHAEAYALKTPASPHYAAELEGREIQLEKIVLPNSDKPLVVETAGGLMSPLSREYSNIDLIVHLGLPCVLVISDYLGSINHTMMSIELLKARQVKLAGLVFNSDRVESSRQYIREKSQLPVIMELPNLKPITPQKVRELAQINKDRIYNLIYEQS